MGFQKESPGVVLTRLSTSMTSVTSVSTHILMAGLNLFFPNRRFFMACLVAALIRGVFWAAPTMWYLTEVAVGGERVMMTAQLVLVVGNGGMPTDRTSSKLVRPERS
jgi:hypothetical protein